MSGEKFPNVVVRDVATAAVKTDLQRRRELKAKTKPELINIIRQLETGIGHLADRIDHAYGDEP